MLLDLGRNDVGRVCAPGTVNVTQQFDVEYYSHVMHLVSHVRGQLREGLTPYDALRSAFPAGTVAGAPKIRAMEIVAELEPDRRGPYAGAVGFFDIVGQRGDCDHDPHRADEGRLGAHSGPAAASCSTPTRCGSSRRPSNKARAMFAAIDDAERGEGGGAPSGSLGY